MILSVVLSLYPVSFSCLRRALGLNIDLSLLKADLSIKDKNDAVKELINERIVNKRTRFYPESVFVFDD